MRCHFMTLIKRIPSRKHFFYKKITNVSPLDKILSYILTNKQRAPANKPNQLTKTIIEQRPSLNKGHQRTKTISEQRPSANKDHQLTKIIIEQRPSANKDHH